MNSKHIACGIVALFIVVLVQVTLWVQGHRTKVQNEASAAQQAEANATALALVDVMTTRPGLLML